MHLEQVLVVEELQVELAVVVLAVHGGVVAGAADGEGALEDERQLAAAPGAT
jgi:hypothetical protein